MTGYEEMFVAINALKEASLEMRRPGDWYVSQHIEIKDDCMLRGVNSGGPTPEAAIASHWRCLTDLQPGQYLVMNGYSDNRKAVRWNGFMWATVDEGITKKVRA